METELQRIIREMGEQLARLDLPELLMIDGQEAVRNSLALAKDALQDLSDQLRTIERQQVRDNARLVRFCSGMQPDRWEQVVNEL